MKYLEFFAGGGMARAGLGPEWECVFANDFDFKKAATYKRNWGDNGDLTVSDIRDIRAADVPAADLAWASFPCQDLSLAGGGAGLKGERSGTFFPFWSLIQELNASDRGPRIVVLENVPGTITSHKGKDFQAICRQMAAGGYAFGAVVIDAALFVPQSRPRLFFIAIRGVEASSDLLSPEPLGPFHNRSLIRAVKLLRGKVADQWLWWSLPTPPRRVSVFAELIEENPDSVAWQSPDETRRLIGMMSAVNLAKLSAAQRAGRRVVGCVYKRTRHEEGHKVQRAEVRFDDVAGCIRTPAGGSSRQLILLVDGPSVRSRLISSRETARLMGLPDSYALPRRYNEAYHLTGDGVVVPVVRHLAAHLIEPLLRVDTGSASQRIEAENAACPVSPCGRRTPEGALGPRLPAREIPAGNPSLRPSPAAIA